MVTDLSLRYLLHVPSGRPETDEMPLVVMLHGRGADMHDLADLAPMLDTAGGIRFVFANAPRQWEAYNGMTFGWTWFDGWPPEHDSVVASREVLLKFADEVTARYPTSKLVLSGFSQGAMMALDAGLRRDVAGIVAMSGGLYDRELPAELTKTPIFIAHGTYDDVVPVDYAQRARDTLTGRGFDVEYHEYPMSHQVAAEEIADVRAFLSKIM